MKRRAGPQEIEQKLITSLWEKRYKITPQRLEIIKLLSRDRSHPGATDILKRIRKTLPQISVSTVYYTLEMLKNEGLLRELEFYDCDNRYDVTIEDHINLICKKCGKIEDFMGALPFSSDAILEQTGFRLEGMRFEYYGYCNKCRQKKKL